MDTIQTEIEVDATPACVPQCGNRLCGDNGCDGVCGTCFDYSGLVAPALCRDDGSCCQQQCEGKVCGDDGCGGLCGECAQGEWGHCSAGQCYYTPGWTVLFYMMGDNDLEGSMFGQISQLMTIGSNEYLNLVIQIDGVAGLNDRPQAWKGGDLRETQRLYITKDSYEVIEELGELDSTNPQTLADFIEWGVKKYPARQYALILDDHGSAYNGIGSDWTNGSWMPLKKIAEGLELGLEAAGVEKFDVLFFYACLMGNYEVAHAMKSFSRYMIASEELAIGSSFRIDRLDAAHDDPDLDAESLSLVMIEDYVPTWKSAFPKVTISLVDLTKMDAFDSALKDFLDYLLVDPLEYIEDIIISRLKAETFASLPYELQSMNLADLGGFLSGLVKQRPDLEEAAAAILDTYDELVVHNFAGPGHAEATGMSIFFPPTLTTYIGTSEFQGTTPGEAYLTIDPPEIWHTFLVNYLFAIPDDQLGPSYDCIDSMANPICSEKNTWLHEGVDEISISWPLATYVSDDTFKTAMLFGTYNMAGGGPQIDIYSELPATLEEESGFVKGTFDYHRLAVSQGDKTSYAYWNLQPEGSNYLLTVPFIYLVPGSDELGSVEWRATISDGDWKVVKSEYYLLGPDGSYTLSGLDETARLYPSVLRLDMQWHMHSWEPLFTFFSAKKPLTVDFVPLETCDSYFYGLFVEDDIGRNDIITANVCHTEGEPQMSVEVKIEAEGPWDEDGAPDFAATLMVDGEPLVEWEVIENEAKPHFLPVTIPKIRWNSTQLILREVDDESEDEFAKYGTLWEFYLADWFCSRNKKWKFKPEEDPRKATTRLIIKKCL